MGGGQKQLTSLYINNNGSSKALNNAYANINGSSKEIFAAIKRHWWKRYKVTQWDYNEGTSFYDSDTDDTTCTDNTWYSASPDAYHYIFSSISFDSSNGEFNLSGQSYMRWTEDSDNETADVWYYWHSRSSGWVFLSSPSQSSGTGIVFHITGGTIVKANFSDGSEKTGISVDFDKFRWRVPKACTSNYTLVYTSDYSQYCYPDCRSDGEINLGSVNSNILGDSDGYTYYSNRDDREEEYYRYYYGYRFMYDGYHS